MYLVIYLFGVCAVSVCATTQCQVSALLKIEVFSECPASD